MGSLSPFSTLSIEISSRCDLCRLQSAERGNESVTTRHSTITVLKMIWALFNVFCATVALYFAAVMVAYISVFGFVGAWLELLIYLAFFTVYTSGMFLSFSAATGIIWIFRTATESVSRAAKTKKID